MNISYTYYQTESQISIPTELPQVMLERAPGFLRTYRAKTGDQNLNNLKEKVTKIQELNKKKDILILALSTEVCQLMVLLIFIPSKGQYIKVLNYATSPPSFILPSN